jgi:hypothetical protein
MTRTLTRIGTAFRRASRLYPAREWIAIAICLVVGLWSYRQAADLVTTQEPPQRDFLVLGLGWREVSAALASEGQAFTPKQAGYQVGTLIQAHGCRNPVDVLSDFTYPDGHRFWRRHARLGRQPAHVDFLVTDPSARNFRLYAHTGFYYDPSLRGGRAAAPVEADLRDERLPARVRRIRFDGRQVTVVSTTLRWIGPAYRQDLIVLYQADWVSRRGHRSCYVDVPEQTDPLVLAAQNVAASQGLGLPSLRPRRGYVQISGPRAGPLEGAVQPFDSTPPPDRIRDNEWTCTYRTGSSCRAVAVLEEPNADGVTQTRLLVYGTLLGLVLGVGIDALRRIRIPPPR